MGYAHRRDFPATWPTPSAYNDPAVSVQSYQDGIEECEYAEEMGFEWVSFLWKFRENVRLSVQHKCHSVMPPWYQMMTSWDPPGIAPSEDLRRPGIS